MVQMNKNFYDPSEAHMVPQHKLEIWPGYVTAVQEYEGVLMLNLDVSHKVLRTQTAYDLVSFTVIQMLCKLELSCINSGVSNQLIIWN